MIGLTKCTEHNKNTIKSNGEKGGNVNGKLVTV